MSASTFRSIPSFLGRVFEEPNFRATVRAHAPELVRGAFHRHPGARIGRGAHLEGTGEFNLAHGSCIRDEARVFVAAGARLTLEAGAAIGARCVVNVEHSVYVGRRTQISWQCQILDTDFHTIEDDSGRSRPRSAPVHIGDDVLIGTGTIILKGVTIGDGAVVAAGAVVTSDVPSHRLVAGNPARDIRSIRSWR